MGSDLERCKAHENALKSMGAQYKLVQNMDNSWSLRFGPLTALEVGKAVSAFVR